MRKIWQWAKRAGKSSKMFYHDMQMRVVALMIMTFRAVFEDDAEIAGVDAALFYAGEFQTVAAHSQRGQTVNQRLPVLFRKAADERS